ncbi:hypothetical protein FRC02_001362 [Tulasnella sp. 418]|nr:hypothetical protein FRC02_001362 [Tulasnella sp. 418]
MPPKYPQSSYRSPFPQPQVDYDDYNTNSPNNPRRWSEGVDLPRPDFNHHGYSEPPPLPPRPQSHFYDEDYYPTEPSSYPKHSPELWKFPEPSIPQPFAFETRPQLQVSSYHESPRPRYDSLYEDRTPVDNYHSEYSSSAYHSQTESRQSSSERLPNTPPNRNSDVFNEELSRLALDVDCIQKFQEGELPEQDEEWHKLVPAAAKDALPKKEVQRQSTIFEVIKSEKDYVLDLQLINEVYIQKLLASSPAVITPRAELEKFVEEMFNNVMEIEKIHEQMVRTLFVRQRQQHPIIDTISDIILDASFSFQSQYEKYIKHYPFAEGRHRRELKSNPLYRDFIDKCNQDTRTRKRDLITLISRPVTRLPRLSLILEHVQKLSPPEHVDVETIPIILGILQQFVKSTQPGIAAAEGKVKFWNYVDSLQFERGEIIDLDPGNETRNLLHTGAVSRLRSRNWEDIDATLSDHYFIMTRPLMKSGMKQNVVASRPIPLDFLQLGTFNLPIEYRKESPNTELEGGSSGGILSALKRDVKVPVYPFVVFHASLHTLRRYTLAVKSEEARKKWQDQLIDALATRKAQQESNKFFAVQQLSGEFFRVKTVLVPADSSLRRKQDYFTGKVSCAGRFNSGGRHFLAVGCSLGIFIGYQSQSSC